MHSDDHVNTTLLLFVYSVVPIVHIALHLPETENLKPRKNRKLS